MKLIATFLAAAALVAVPVASDAAHANSEANTRQSASLPASVKYIKHSAVTVSPGVRCFSAKVTRTTKVLDTRVIKGHRVGYCTDGYVDTYNSLGATEIRAAR